VCVPRCRRGGRGSRRMRVKGNGVLGIARSGARWWGARAGCAREKRKPPRERTFAVGFFACDLVFFLLSPLRARLLSPGSAGEWLLHEAARSCWSLESHASAWGGVCACQQLSVDRAMQGWVVEEWAVQDSPVRRDDVQRVVVGGRRGVTANHRIKTERASSNEWRLRDE